MAQMIHHLALVEKALANLQRLVLLRLDAREAASAEKEAMGYLAS